LQGGKDATKKVGGWKPLASHIRVGKDRKSLKLGSEDDGRTGTKSGDPDDGAPSSQAKAKEQLTRKGNLPKKTGSRKVFTLKGKKKRFKAKQPTQKGRLRALWFYLVAAFDQ
jgi:E3 ubiquitin-protein ligase DRIP